MALLLWSLPTLMFCGSMGSSLYWLWTLQAVFAKLGKEELRVLSPSPLDMTAESCLEMLGMGQEKSVLGQRQSLG